MDSKSSDVIVGFSNWWPFCLGQTKGTIDTNSFLIGALRQSKLSRQHPLTDIKTSKLVLLLSIAGERRSHSYFFYESDSFSFLISLLWKTHQCALLQRYVGRESRLDQERQKTKLSESLMKICQITNI
jgi:hypothetical protein